ncbi:hypothetical protein ABMA28_003275 [Loxostege sticticalis]|uniref:Uncharacterized protein n=1 Tax=Loxostege sticticalis TaxID=481309 RepID=A0ABD0SVK4_LOXSC
MKLKLKINVAHTVNVTIKTKRNVVQALRCKINKEKIIIPRRISSSFSSSSLSDSSSSLSSDDESNRTEVSRVNTPGDSNSTPTNVPASSSAIDTAPSVSEPKVSKKRKRNPASWKSKIAKTLRNIGKAYCKTKIEEPVRQEIFKQFWQLSDLERRREYIVRHTQDIKPKYRYITSQKLRAMNSAYYFEKDSNMIRVCKEFFKATLSISDRYIKTAL